MPDREKVLKGLESCQQSYCKGCPYHTEGLYDQLFMDVAFILEKYIEEGRIRWEDL